MWDRSKPEQLASRLRSRINDAELEPGSYLGTKSHLCDTYEVALSTLNESLGILKAEGLVSVRTGPGGGVSVAASPPLVRLGRKLLRLDGQSFDVAECLLVRNAIEPLVVNQATLYATAVDVEELREIVNRMAVNNTDDLTFLRLNMELHERVATIIPDGLLRSLYVGVLGFIGEHTVGVIPDPGTADRAATRLEVHRQLVDAIASGDIAQAEEAELVHRSFVESGAPQLGKLS